MYSIIQPFCEVRFLNAVKECDPICIIIGSKLVCRDLAYSNISPYIKTSKEFKVLTITSANSHKNVLFQSEIQFNEPMTLAIIESANGVKVLNICDSYCLNNPKSDGEIKMVNLAFNSPPLGLSLKANKIFNGIEYKGISLPKRIMPKEYEFNIFQKDLNNLISTFYLDIKPKLRYTIYILGNWSKLITVKAVDNE